MSYITESQYLLPSCKIPSIITCFMHLILPHGQNEVCMGILNCVLKLKSLIWPETLFEVLGQLYILIFCLKSKVIALVSSFNSVMTSPSLLWKVWAKFNPFTINLMWLVIHSKLPMTCEQLWIKKRTFYYMSTHAHLYLIRLILGLINYSEGFDFIFVFPKFFNLSLKYFGLSFLTPSSN